MSLSDFSQAAGIDQQRASSPQGPHAPGILWQPMMITPADPSIAGTWKQHFSPWGVTVGSAVASEAKEGWAVDIGCEAMFEGWAIVVRFQEPFGSKGNGCIFPS